MSEKTKTILLIVASVLGLILVCYLAVCIACSINGLTFGEQICSMFGQAPIVVFCIYFLLYLYIFSQTFCNHRLYNSQMKIHS